MSTPLVFVGSYFGFKRETISAPVRTNQIGNVDAIYVDAIHSKGLFELPFELPLTFIPPFYLPLTAHTPSHNTPSHMLLLTSYQYTLSSLTSYEHPPPPPLSTARHIPDQVWYTLSIHTLSSLTSYQHPSPPPLYQQPVTYPTKCGTPTPYSAWH